MAWQLKDGSVRLAINPDKTLALSFQITDGGSTLNITPDMVGRVSDYDPTNLRLAVARQAKKFLDRQDRESDLAARASQITDTSVVNSLTNDEVFPAPTPRQPTPEELARREFVDALRLFRQMEAALALSAPGVTRNDVNAQLAVVQGLWLPEYLSLLE